MAIGEVKKIPTEYDIEWSIQNFFSLSKECNNYYYSPPFSFEGTSWYFQIFPNGNKVSGVVSLYLYRDSANPPIRLEYTFGIKTLNGKKDSVKYISYVFQKAHQGYGEQSFLLRSNLLERKSDLMPADVLTIVCSLKNPKSNGDINDIETAECSHCKEAVDAKIISLHEKKCLDKPIKCPDCSEVILLQNWYGHKCQMTKVEDDGSLCQDYRKVLLEGQNHDLILKVGDKELKAHQDILRARSRVFKSMLSHDMMEKKNGIIDAPDCDPEAMELFLSYIYSGKIETLGQNIMIGLYYIADKYEMMGLKEECSNFIKKSLSPTNICDVIQLALNHSDSSLLECATEYFVNNVESIMHTLEWQSFLKDNSTVGNELLLKSIEKLKNVKV